MSVSSYIVTCLTEGVRVVTDYRETLPTTCPNNNTHTIDPDQTKVYKSGSIKQTTVLENSEGYYQATSICFDIPGATGTYTKDVSWPSDITLWTSAMYVTPDCVDDVFELVAAPDTVIGVITATGSIGDTGLHVSPTVITYLQRGINATLFNGVTRNELGRVTQLDGTSGTINFETALTSAFAPGTYVMINVHTVSNFQICQSMANAQNGISLGAKGIKGKLIPAHTTMRLVYHNLNGLAKTVAWKIEYYLMG